MKEFLVIAVPLAAVVVGAGVLNNIYSNNHNNSRDSNHHNSQDSSRHNTSYVSAAGVCAYVYVCQKGITLKTFYKFISSFDVSRSRITKFHCVNFRRNNKNDFCETHESMYLILKIKWGRIF